MKHALAAISALAFLAGAGIASAAEVTGTVKSIDSAQNRIELQEGGIYDLFGEPGTSALDIGDRVHIEWSSYSADNYPLARSVTVLSDAPESYSGAPTPSAPGEMTGRISAIDQAKNEITLHNGYVFKLGANPGAGDLDVGDAVHISWNTYDHGVLKANEVEVVDSLSMGDTGMDPTAMDQTAASTHHQVSGTVTSVDQANNRIMLSDGSAFQLADGVDASDIAIGDRIIVQWTSFSDGFRVADAVWVAPPQQAAEPGYQSEGLEGDDVYKGQDGSENDLGTYDLETR